MKPAKKITDAKVVIDDEGNYVYETFADAWAEYEIGRFLRRIGDPRGAELLKRSAGQKP
jgi:hypothetical protein